MFASLFDIFIVSRTNIRFGIHDKVAYLFGDAIVMTTASMLSTMPVVVLTAKICPAGYESTTYALVAGFQNFGQNVSQSIGLFMTSLLGIKATGECNFDNLNLLVFLSHFVLPFFTIPLTFVLIPKAKISGTLDLGPKLDNLEELEHIVQHPLVSPSTVIVDSQFDES